MSATAHEWIVPHSDETDVRRPLLPSEDPFHDAPGDLARLSPGTIIRSRQVRVGFLGLIPQRGLTAWQLAYRSTDLHGRPEVAVSTVIVPRRRDEARPQGLIAYQCAIDAVADRCFPSYALRPGARSWGALPQLELMLMASLLERGHVLTIADHEGRGGYFAAPREPGFRTLDGIRAALAFPALDLDADTDVALFGYSGGGMATAWAAEMAPTYAPELSVVGAVAGSPVGDPGQAFIKLNGGLNAGLPALVVAGLRHIYPGLDRVIKEHASVDGIRRLDALEEQTTVVAVATHAFNDFDDYLDSPLADVLATPEILHVFDDLRLGSHVPRCPLLVVQSVNDQIIDVDEVDTQVRAYLDEGADVRYVRDRLSEHLSLMVLAMPVMMEWMEQRFEGADIENGTETVTSVALSLRAWAGFARMLGAAAKTVVGRAG
ncbi:lipase [Nocardioides sp. JQ2195]|uniref:lipase family protein n=1 Tax=Nocardioides sp. JQ2195 TaxID=2592334 RepID=UPI00143E66DD|nr:lipase family protein [Nocardioides sp. JQ2195]QIX28425.1 lipase [Nocardioides sp. JQ2195]